jgi:hypothetical protein
MQCNVSSGELGWNSGSEDSSIDQSRVSGELERSKSAMHGRKRADGICQAIYENSTQLVLVTLCRLIAHVSFDQSAPCASTALG